jgi:hypothetical protein
MAVGAADSAVVVIGLTSMDKIISASIGAFVTSLIGKLQTSGYCQSLPIVARSEQ